MYHKQGPAPQGTKYRATHGWGMHEWLQRVLAWLGLTRDTTDEQDRQGDGSDNETNASQPPSRPDTPTPTPPETDPTEMPLEEDPEVDIPDDAMPPEVPCVGNAADNRWQTWDQWRPMPTPPDDPTDTIEVKLWPERGHPDIHTGLEMTAPHMEYAVLDAYGDTYDITVTVADTAIPEYVKDRSGFREYVRERSDEEPARHVNVHAGSDGPPGTGCCGWAYANVEDYFDGVTWTTGDCVKRRRWGPNAYAAVRVIHEGLHGLDLTHYKEETRVDGVWHSTLMGVSYTSNEEKGWHLFELHPEDGQRPTLNDVL